MCYGEVCIIRQAILWQIVAWHPKNVCVMRNGVGVMVGICYKEFYCICIDIISLYHRTAGEALRYGSYNCQRQLSKLAAPH
jgi:hypothetical protein